MLLREIRIVGNNMMSIVHSFDKSFRIVSKAYFALSA